MEEHPHTHYQKEHPNSHPWWKRAHRDWRVWIAVVIMLAAMFVYLKTNDLSHPSQGAPRQPVP